MPPMPPVCSRLFGVFPTCEKALVCRAGLGSIPGEPVVAPQADPDVPMLKVAKAEYEKLQ